MSKSKGNAIMPAEIVNKFGADVLRSVGCIGRPQNRYENVAGGIKQLSEGYRKIRNTTRYILSNINDFDPNKDMVKYADMLGNRPLGNDETESAG